MTSINSKHLNHKIPASKSNVINLDPTNNKRLNRVNLNSSEDDYTMILSSINRIRDIVEDIPERSIYEAFISLCDSSAKKSLVEMFGGKL